MYFIGIFIMYSKAAVVINRIDFSISFNISTSGFKLLHNLWIFVNLILVLMYYFVNKKGDNEKFIERYFVLQFPVTIKTILIVVPLSILSAWFAIPEYAVDKVSILICFTIPLSLILVISFMFNGLKIASGQMVEATFNKWAVFKAIIIGLVIYALLFTAYVLYEEVT